MARSARAEQLRKYGRSVLEGARSDQVLRMARQVNAMSYTSAREYAGRSLFELLQSGYDAHPRDRRDGRVHVLLDEAEGEWTGRTQTTGRTRGWRYGGGTDSGLTTAQREAIGYVGEWYAYQWLCARYPDRMDETCWVSGNRRKAFPGPSGDDGLGFDFRVGSGSQPYLYEVKATAGEGGRFELGESEVRAARQHAGNDRWRLLVVTHALTSHRVAIQMLPNPYGKRGQGRYREEGGALRFSYPL
ncbi:DUF3883 domain-containing protein [Streptomyces sp. NPDC006235]|uniref:protein NO VEIN domain-containing protein n=1 Tax=Streptomyces sp. NPDC006235 TaxID=3156736 RepID=UPI00339EC535